MVHSARCQSRRVLQQIRRRNKILAAAKAGNIKLVKYWLRRGVNVNNVDKDGKTALNVAVCLKNTEMVKVLRTPLILSLSNSLGFNSNNL